jgi:hypothetical protein
MVQTTMPMADGFLAALAYAQSALSASLNFAWGGDDTMTVAILKRSFLLVPLVALIVSLIMSVPNILSLIVRSHRTEFMGHFLATWWDLFHAVFSYMAGIIKAVAKVLGVLFSALRLAVLGLWTLLLDVLLAPFKAVREVGRNIAAPGLPWIATVLTVLWCLLEAVIFTYVMTPLVMDTVSNLSGEDLYPSSVRVPLFLFLLTVILGSYAVLSAWTQALKERNVSAILRITAVELVAVLLEILFLYREFVDALVPWFAMHSSKNFEPGAVVILLIAFMIWLGVRGMTWFLFASHGTPILLALIQGQGLGTPAPAGETPGLKPMEYSNAFVEKVKADMGWLDYESTRTMEALVLPPMQLVAASVNFVTLLFSGKNLISLPLKDSQDLMQAAQALRPNRGKNHPGTGTPAAVAGAGTKGGLS